MGRLNIEPWLESRVMKETVTLWPKTRVLDVDEVVHDALSVRLDNGETFPIDIIFSATGYQVRIDRTLFLARGEYPGQAHNGQRLSPIG